MLSISALVSVAVYLIVAGLIWYVLFWLINFCNPPEPFSKIASVLLAIIAATFVINLLLGLINDRPLLK